MSYPNMVDVTGMFEYLGPRQTLKLVVGHFSAVLLYVSCSLQFPAFNLTADVDDQYKNITSTMSYVLLTLLVWTVFSFHYFIFGGGIKFANSTSWELRAAGMFMITAPKTHKAMTFFSLIVSCLAAFQFFTFDFLMEKFISTKNHYVLYKFFLLKVHAIFCVIMVSYSIFRIVHDPKIMAARTAFLEKQRAEKSKKLGRRRNQAVSAEGWPVIGNEPQECTICASRAANRQLRCGHVICCCCIAKIASTKSCVTCPFCRVEVFNARKLLVEPEKTTVPLVNCEECEKEEEEDTQVGLREEEHSRTPIQEETSERDGAAAVLLPMPEIVPNMGI